MHFTTPLLALALTTPILAEFTKNPVLIPKDPRDYPPIVLRPGMSPLNITKGGYGPFKDLYPDCSFKSADTYFTAYGSRCESFFTNSEHGEAARACICMHIWGPLIDGQYAYQKELKPRVEADCKGKEGEEETEDLELQTWEFCNRQPAVESRFSDSCDGMVVLIGTDVSVTFVDPFKGKESLAGGVRAGEAMMGAAVAVGVLVGFL
ncbi:hypothetical protein BJ508DRAFT_36977 [Ascobolus immersus RN42]|uniref:Uncharacterized protein n=1 Tax=Ascobolus immersus RN42 TaxID=1160509 RepID=A0A3N4II19_ASCIM|nr:hypothetical protein BJ508DRAFT_36977 [Ascobolus immersus RN42]